MEVSDGAGCGQKSTKAADIVDAAAAPDEEGHERPIDVSVVGREDASFQDGAQKN